MPRHYIDHYGHSWNSLQCLVLGTGGIAVGARPTDGVSVDRFECGIHAAENRKVVVVGEIDRGACPGREKAVSMGRMRAATRKLPFSGASTPPAAEWPDCRHPNNPSKKEYMVRIGMVVRSIDTHGKHREALRDPTLPRD